MNAPYGYCPVCGLPGVTRERRPGGDDRCDAGHAYPSSTARQAAPEPALTAEEIERLRQTLDAMEKERDQWIESALDRRQALHDADALRTGVYLALSPEGGANGWRPSRGVDELIDLALDVRESRDAQQKRADSLALAYREEQGRSAAIQIEAERHRRIADEAVTRIESAEEEERAAVVAWLRGTPATRLWRQEPMDAAADCIERGEHRVDTPKADG